MAADLAASAVGPHATLAVGRARKWRAAAGVWVFLLALVHGALYAVLTPPWQAPDEIAHFEYAWLLGQVGHPLWNEDASPELEQTIISSLYQFHAWDYVGLPTPATPPERLDDAPFFRLSRTLTRFSLSYIPYAVAALPFSQAGVITQLYVMRAVSILYGALVVGLTYRMSRLVEPASPALAWGSALFVLFLPQHGALTSTVSDGSLAELLATVAVYGVVLVWQKGLTWLRLAAILASSLGALFAKSTALFLLPLLALSAMYLLIKWLRVPNRTRQEHRAAWLVVGLATVSLAIGSILMLPWLNRVSSQVTSVTATLAETLGSLRAWSAYLQRLLRGSELAVALVQTVESFWGYFGWMVIRTPAWWRTAQYALATLALLGWIRRGLGHRQVSSRPYIPIALAAGLAVLVLLTWFVLTPVGLEYSQGRYVFGAIAPLAILLTAGYFSWLPERTHRWLLLGLTVAWATLDAVALWGVLVPYFYRLG